MRKSDDHAVRRLFLNVAHPQWMHKWKQRWVSTVAEPGETVWDFYMRFCRVASEVAKLTREFMAQRHIKHLFFAKLEPALGHAAATPLTQYIGNPTETIETMALSLRNVQIPGEPTPSAAPVAATTAPVSSPRTTPGLTKAAAAAAAQLTCDFCSRSHRLRSASHGHSTPRCPEMLNVVAHARTVVNVYREFGFALPSPPSSTAEGLAGVTAAAKKVWIMGAAKQFLRPLGALSCSCDRA
ncbi:hypothetical protein H9P43_006852 [Blastocladiella emersonii ATCC 22665]|nr:hypothetical protein H9P43_006852 [Blastocladiella emersonii ATCC 22665]